MNLHTVIAALPWARRLWRVMPGPLRVPLLLIAAVVGIVNFLQGRKASNRSSGDGSGAPARRDDGPPPPPRTP